MPLDVVGEVYLGGVQVSRGYVNRPNETNKTFCDDHVSHHPGEMMYQIGDRGYWNGYGEIELLGHSDRQIKLRGFPVDLNDPEIRIEKLVLPEAAVAVAFNGNDLIAMVAALESRPVHISVLKIQVADVVPAHCLPRHYVSTTTLPLTPVGKVDYNAIFSSVNFTQVQVAKYFQSSSTDLVSREKISETIATVWREVWALTAASKSAKMIVFLC